MSGVYSTKDVGRGSLANGMASTNRPPSTLAFITPQWAPVRTSLLAASAWLRPMKDGAAMVTKLTVPVLLMNLRLVNFWPFSSLNPVFDFF
jgi:hypothetical protein